MRHSAPRSFSHTLLACISIAATAAVVGFQFGATRDDGGPSDDQAEAMAALAAYATPGSMQEFLARRVGRWNGALEMWPAPGAEAITGTGVATYTMDLGGRYLVERNESLWMGQPFVGLGWTGYDNSRKVFQYSWIDTMGTGIARGEGTLNEAGTVLNWTSIMTDPVKGALASYRSTDTWLDANTMESIMFGVGTDGAEYRMMRIVLARDTSTSPPATDAAATPQLGAQGK